MKKYSRIMIISVFIYAVIAAACAIYLGDLQKQENHEYRVERNRIYSSLPGVEALDRLDLRSYKYIKEVSFLPASILTKDEVTGFYTGGNNDEIEIIPWYRGHELLGYLKFSYEKEEIYLGNVLLAVQIALFIMELFTFAVLLYLRERLIKPFHKMSEMPEELAQGRLKGLVKEEKNRYFGNFLWGMAQLKDELAVSEKRRMELEKERKNLLLVLSHDIKTPLNTIRLYGKALAENLYQDAVKEQHAAEQIGVKTREIELFVEEIMKTSREDILDIQVENGEFYLAELMDKVLADYSEKCAVRMIELQVDKYENRLLRGDLNRAREVLENIFENAFKYGDGRHIKIRFYEEDYCQLIHIFNTGIPVTDNEFNHIFESFFRGGNSNGKQGNGLGLYICREIMRKMDGEIFAQKEMAGMSFTVVFR